MKDPTMSKHAEPPFTEGQLAVIIATALQHADLCERVLFDDPQPNLTSKENAYLLHGATTLLRKLARYIQELEPQEQEQEKDND